MDIAMEYVNKITSDPMLLGIAGGVLAVLIALIALVTRRKGKGEEEEEIEVPVTQAPATVEAVEEPAKPSFFAGLMGKIKSASKKKEKEPSVEDLAEEFEEAGETEIKGAEQPAAAPAAEPKPEDATVYEAPVDEGGVADMAFEEDTSQPPPDTTQDAPVVEAAPGVAQADDVAGDALVQPGDARKQWHGSGVHVHAHGVYAVLHYCVQLTRQFYLADVVLVLADADGLRIDFHQFRQWILQAPGTGHRAANGYVEVGKLLCREFGSRVDGGA